MPARIGDRTIGGTCDTHLRIRCRLAAAGFLQVAFHRAGHCRRRRCHAGEGQDCHGPLLAIRTLTLFHVPPRQMLGNVADGNALQCLCSWADGPHDGAHTRHRAARRQSVRVLPHGMHVEASASWDSCCRRQWRAGNSRRCTWSAIAWRSIYSAWSCRLHQCNERAHVGRARQREGGNTEALVDTTMLHTTISRCACCVETLLLSISPRSSQ